MRSWKGEKVKRQKGKTIRKGERGMGDEGYTEKEVIWLKGRGR